MLIPALKSYFSALKIQVILHCIAKNIHDIFFSKISYDNKKVMKEICLFLKQKNICHRDGFNNFLKFTIYNENKDYIENGKINKCYKFNDTLISYTK